MKNIKFALAVLIFACGMTQSKTASAEGWTCAIWPDEGVMFCCDGDYCIKMPIIVRDAEPPLDP